MSQPKKNHLLKENFSSACYKLKKNIMFGLAGQLGLLVCLRCKKVIECVKDFSVDNKEAWMCANDPIQSFYSLTNIAFSHTRCNSAHKGALSPTCKMGHTLPTKK